MLHACHKVTGSVLWANLHLLFWLSLIPFTTAWMGENHYAEPPTALYGFVLLMAAIAYYILQSRIIAAQGGDSVIERAVGSGLERQAVADPVRVRDPDRIRITLGVEGDLCRCRADLARARPAHRARPRAPGGLHDEDHFHCGAAGGIPAGGTRRRRDLPLRLVDRDRPR